MSALINISSGATRNALVAISKLSGPVQVLPKTTASSFFQNLFKTAPKVVIPTASKVGQGTIKSIFSKTNVISSGIFGTTALLSLTQGGQNIVTTTGQGISDVTNLGKSINDLLVKNPILPIGLLLLGGLVIVSVIKK